MAHLPFFSKYPYTSFERLNLDWLMETVGKWEDRLNKAEATIADHEIRITSLEGRMDEAEEDIDSLQEDMADVKPRLTQAEEDIDSLQEDMADIKPRLTQAEGDIDDLQGDVSDLKDRMTEAENDISDLKAEDLSLSNRIQGNTNDIISLDSRIDSLEEHSVIANLGGTTSAVLSTLLVDGVNYEVPQGGGGGGSTVIPNASGTSQGDLNTIGIDGYIYDIPSGVDTSDMIAEEYDPTDFYDTGDCVIHDGSLYRALDDGITGAWDSSKWVTTTCTEIANNAADTAAAIQQMYADLGTAYEDSQTSVELYTRSSGMDSIPGVNHTLTPGSWIVTLNATFDTHELGSKQRVINIYLVDGSDNIIAQFGKYMWGSEAIQGILYENSCSLSAVIDVPYGTTKQIYGKVAVRVNTGSGSYGITTIRLGSVRIKPYAS